MQMNVRVFISYAHDNAQHEHKVQRLCDTLREQGIDARIDIPDAVQRQDWPLWMLDQFLEADFVLVIASPEYKRRAEGRAPDGEGLGVQWEASLIRNDLYGNPRTAVHRYLPVILPGCSVSDIPIWMGSNSATHYAVASYTPVGTALLMQVLRHRGDKSTQTLTSIQELTLNQASMPEAPASRLRRDIARRLSGRSTNRTTSMICADIQQFLLLGSLGLNPADLHQLEDDAAYVIDVETAYTIIVVSRDTRTSSTLRTARHKLQYRLQRRSEQTGERYAGIITDGSDWQAYIVLDNSLRYVASTTTMLTDSAIDDLLMWLESIFATKQNITPTPKEICRRLGIASPAYKLDAAELAELYRKNCNFPNVQVKRRMWARLLTTASGTNFTDDDSLFANHTLLVAMAKIIGHSVINFHPEDPGVSAGSIMSGSLFAQAQITGVIETDFFDWVVDVPGGERYVKSLARRTSRFAWGDVEHDVLKTLYQSIITKETRKQLGEHYTPDWLADEIVADCINDPLKQRVLDASCGSGTFLFHAVRRYIDAALKEGASDADVINGAVEHIFGIDVHPVAVTLARVTYLLAIGMERLRSNRHPPFAVPVFLGDSLKWGMTQALWSYEGLSIPTGDDEQTFISDPDDRTKEDFKDRLRFPDRVVANTHRFDELVTDLADMAASRAPGDPVPKLTRVFAKFLVGDGDQAAIKRTFKNMCDLHDSGRNHIWGYYVRNLARPAWLAQPGNRLDVLVGNPPWLAYREMTQRQQKAFRAMTDERGFGGTRRFAPTRDLAALFVVRCVEQYLKPGGRFGFVMPGAVLAGDHYKDFRSAVYGGNIEQVMVRFERPWDLHNIKPKFFSQHVGVVFGHRTLPSEGAVPLTEVPEIWSGRFATLTASKSEARRSITRTIGELPPMLAARGSPYEQRFHEGATFVPQFAFLVERKIDSSLGVGIGRTAIKSRRSNNEHPPWANIDTLDETIEDEFLRPVYLGESVLPFRLLEPAEAIVPWNGDRLLRGSEEDLYPYRGLKKWWFDAETIWNENSSGKLSFRARLDYQRGLTKQLPPAEIRVVYNKSGKFLASAIIEKSRAVIAQQLYWTAAASLEEARFISAILNSTYVTLAVRPLQSRGEHNPRDFGRLPLRLPIPLYDMHNPDHESLAHLARRAEQVAQNTTLPKGDFKDLRGHVRELLARDGVMAEMDSIVKRLLTW